jgi:hypothetical protein
MLILKDAVLAENNAELLLVLRDRLCRAILQVGRQKSEHVVIVSQLLRTLHLVVSYASSHIIPQLLSFIVSIHLYPACASLHETFSKPVDPQQTEGTESDIQERYEMIMESLLEFCSEPAFPPFVFETFDLDVHAPNVFENLCKFLSNAFVTPPSAPPTISQLHVIALDCILAMLLTIATRCTQSRDPSTSSESILKRQQAKDQLLRFAKAFKEHPGKSMAVLKQCTSLDLSPTASGWDIGEFLFRHRDVLDKDILGDFLGELGKDPLAPLPESDTDGSATARWEVERENSHGIPGRVRFHQHVMKGYINCHNFKNKHLLSAMRELLCGFRIAGEAQKIDRTMEEFASQWHSCNRESPKDINPFASADACFVFSFSCIMLNTDLHSKSIASKEKMTLPQFMNMNKGINAGGNLPDAYITSVYTDVQTNEMKLRDSVYHAFEDDFLWSAEVAKSVQLHESTRLTIRTTDPALLGSQDNVVFSVLWRPALTALSYVLDVVGHSTLVAGSKEAYMMQNVLDGFHICATIAQHFKRSDVVDQIVVTLCKYSHALTLRNAFRSVVDFGVNLRGLHSVKCIFSIVRTCGNSLQDSWKDVTELVVKLYLLGLLPEQCRTDPTTLAAKCSEDSMLEVYHGAKSNVFYHNPGVITQDMKSGNVSSTDAASNGWLSSIFGGNAEAAGKARQIQLKKELSQLQRVETLIEECAVTEIFEVQSTILDDEALTYLIRGIMRAGWYEKNVSTTTVLRVDAHSMSFCIHAITCVLLSNVRRERLLLPSVRDYCTNILSSASAAIEAMSSQPSHNQKNTTYYWMTVGENTCLCLLRLWYNSLPTYHDEFFALLDALKPQSFAVFASTYICGLFYTCVKQSPPVKMATTPAQWEVVVRLIHKAAVLTKNPKARICAFSVLTYIASLGEFSWPDTVPSLVEALAQVYMLCVQDGQKFKGFQSTATCEEIASDWDVVPPQAPISPPIVTCDDLATPCIEVERVRLDGIVEILYTFHERLVRCISNVKAPTPNWIRAWFSVLRGLCTIVFTTDGVVSGRKGGDAMLALQRALLDPTLQTLPPTLCLDVMKDIVIPLIEKLCHNPNGVPGSNAPATPTTSHFLSFTGIMSSLFSVHAGGDEMDVAPKYANSAVQEELQARSLSLLTKVFLHNVLQLSLNRTEFIPLWSKMLAMLFAFHTRPPNASSERLVCDAVHEGVKNLIFVLSSLVVADKNPFLTPYPEFWSTTKALVKVFEFSAPLMPHLDAMEGMKPIPLRAGS